MTSHRKLKRAAIAFFLTLGAPVAIAKRPFHDVPIHCRSYVFSAASAEVTNLASDSNDGSFPAVDEQVAVRSEVTGIRSSTGVTHVWILGERVVANEDFLLVRPPWQAISRRALKVQPGDWRVEVLRTRDRQLIDSVSFEVRRIGDGMRVYPRSLPPSPNRVAATQPIQPTQPNSAHVEVIPEKPLEVPPPAPSPVAAPVPVAAIPATERRSTEHILDLALSFFHVNVSGFNNSAVSPRHEIPGFGLGLDVDWIQQWKTKFGTFLRLNLHRVSATETVDGVQGASVGETLLGIGVGIKVDPVPEVVLRAFVGYGQELYYEESSLSVDVRKLNYFVPRFEMAAKYIFLRRTSFSLAGELGVLVNHLPGQSGSPAPVNRGYRLRLEAQRTVATDRMRLGAFLVRQEQNHFHVNGFRTDFGIEIGYTLPLTEK